MVKFSGWGNNLVNREVTRWRTRRFYERKVVVNLIAITQMKVVTFKFRPNLFSFILILPSTDFSSDGY